MGSLNLLLGEVLAGLDVLQEFGDGGLEELLLVLVQLAVAEVLGHSALSEQHRVGEVAGLRQVRLDVRALDHVGLALWTERELSIEQIFSNSGIISGNDAGG